MPVNQGATRRAPTRREPLNSARHLRYHRLGAPASGEDTVTSSALALEGFDHSSFRAADGAVHDLWRRGTGPAVIVIHEVPGITPLVAAFTRRVADRGLSAVMPSLFGEPGRAP